MLSLRRSMRDMDQNEAAHRAAAKAFAEAAETAAKHVVEVDPDEAHRFRRQVLSLAERLGDESKPEELTLARTLFHNELRGYAEKAAGDIRRMKQDLSAAAEAMQSFAQGVCSSGSEHEAVLNREFQVLTRAADCAEITTMRSAIHETVATVTSSYQELKQAHSVVITQLRDEIRVLQQDLQRERKPVPSPDAWIDKAVLDARIEEMLRRRQPFRLMLVGLPALAERRIPAQVLEHVNQELVKTLHALSQSDPQNLARCSPRLYAAILPALGTPPNPSAWEQKLASCHVFKEGDILRTLRVDPRVIAIEHGSSDSPMAFFAQLSAATKELQNS